MSEPAPYTEHSDDEFVEVGDIAEEIRADGPAPEDDHDDMDTEDIEIDMSNNSWAYFDQHKDSVFTVFAHPTLPMVVTGGGDNTAYMWTTHTQPPRFVGELAGHKESVICGDFIGKDFVVTGDMNGYVQVHRSAKGGQKWVRFAELDEVDEVLWITAHKNMPYFAFGALDGLVWVYHVDAAQGTVEQMMVGYLHTLECNGGVFLHEQDPNRLELLTVLEDGLIVKWDAFSGAAKYKLQPHDDFKGIESPWVSVLVHDAVFAAGARDGQLVIVNLDSGKVLQHVKTIDNVEDVADLSIEALAWCDSVKLLAVGLVSGDVMLWDTLLWRLRRTIKLDDSITRLEFIADSPVLVGLCMNGKIYKWDARTGEELFVGVGHNMGVLDFAVVEGGRKLVTAGDEGVSLVFDSEA